LSEHCRTWSLLRDHAALSLVIPGLGEWEERGVLRCCLGMMLIVEDGMVEMT
jgi:hypothetical protein